MIAVIVPAHNEEALIASCIHSVRIAAADPRLAGESVVIVVAADACSDATGAVAEHSGARVLTVEHRCVGAARHSAASYAIGLGARWIASTDADSVVPATWLHGQMDHVHPAFCGTVHLGPSAVLSTADRDEYERRYHHHDGHSHVHGANLGLRASLYTRIGGFPDLATGEDVALVKAIERAGIPIAWRAEPRVITSARLHGRAPKGFADFLVNLSTSAGPVEARRRNYRDADPLVS